MKCKECSSCRLGYFKSSPELYVCIGVKHPFVIADIDNECTEYEEKRDVKIDDLVTVTITKAEYEELLEYKRMYEDLCY